MRREGQSRVILSDYTADFEAAHEQSAGLQQINTTVSQMDQDTQTNAAMVEETAAATHSLSQNLPSMSC